MMVEPATRRVWQPNEPNGPNGNRIPRNGSYFINPADSDFPRSCRKRYSQSWWWWCVNVSQLHCAAFCLAHFRTINNLGGKISITWIYELAKSTAPTYLAILSFLPFHFMPRFVGDNPIQGSASNEQWASTSKQSIYSNSSKMRSDRDICIYV